MSDIIIKRIPALPEGTVPKPGYKLAVWNSDTNTTEQIDAQQFLTAVTSGNYDWVNTTVYVLDQVVFYQGELWASLQNGNVGNVPQPGVWWTNINQSQGSGLVGWQAGAYTADEVYVTHDPGAGKEIYELVNVTRPYNSADIDAEILLGDWVLISASAALDILFDGNRVIKALPAIGQNLGTTSIKDWMEEAYYPSLVATISQASQALHEVGESFAPTIIGTITPLDSIILVRRVRETIGNTIVANPVTNAVNELLPAVILVEGITKTYQIEADVTTDAIPSTEISPQRNLEGVYPFLYGMNAAPGLIGNPLYVAMIHVLQKQGEKIFNYVGTNEKMYFAYIATYPDLTSIKDPNGFEILGAVFPSVPTTALVASNGLGLDYNVSFKIYESINPVTANGDFKFTF